MDLESSVELVTRAREGDRDAMNRLLARYLPRLRKWAAGRLPPEARDMGDTNDVVQDALIGTFRNLERFEHRGEGALQAYLRQAVLNRIRDQVRRVGRRPPRDPLDTGLASPDVSPLDAAIGREKVDRYERALAQLDDQEQQVIIARIEFGHTWEEVAALVDKPTAGAARAATTRAVEKLARLMVPRPTSSAAPPEPPAVRDRVSAPDHHEGDRQHREMPMSRHEGGFPGGADIPSEADEGH